MQLHEILGDIFEGSGFSSYAPLCYRVNARTDAPEELQSLVPCLRRGDRTMLSYDDTARPPVDALLHDIDFPPARQNHEPETGQF
jgi:hypothetical protein